MPGRRHSEKRRTTHVVSVRVDDYTLAAIREQAEADGVTVSEWMRRASAAEIHERQQPPKVPGYRAVGWQCDHMNITSLPGVLGKVTSGCGCEMQPVYAAA